MNEPSLAQRFLAWIGVEPSGTHVHMPTHSAPLLPESVALAPTAPGLEAQRYSDANYHVSRESEARKMRVMSRICAVNNAAAEDVIDRKGTRVRPAQPSASAPPLSYVEEHDALYLADVTYVAEKNHDSRA